MRFQHLSAAPSKAVRSKAPPPGTRVLMVLQSPPFGGGSGPEQGSDYLQLLQVLELTGARCLLGAPRSAEQEVTRSCWAWAKGGDMSPSVRAGLERVLGRGSPRKVAGVPQLPGPTPVSFLQETMSPGSP